MKDLKTLIDSAAICHETAHLQSAINVSKVRLLPHNLLNIVKYVTPPTYLLVYVLGLLIFFGAILEHFFDEWIISCTELILSSLTKVIRGYYSLCVIKDVLPYAMDTTEEVFR